MLYRIKTQYQKDTNKIKERASGWKITTARRALHYEKEEKIFIKQKKKKEENKEKTNKPNYKLTQKGGGKISG